MAERDSKETRRDPTIIELRQKLKELGLPTSGSKAELLNRVMEEMRAREIVVLHREDIGTVLEQTTDGDKDQPARLGRPGSDTRFQLCARN